MTERDETCTEASFLLDPADPNLLIAHPPSVNDCNGWSTAAWEAPSDGTASIQITIEEDDTCVGGGVDLEIHDDSGALLWSHYDTDMGVVYEYDALSDVSTGERLYLWNRPRPQRLVVRHHGHLLQRHPPRGRPVPVVRWPRD